MTRMIRYDTPIYIAAGKADADLAREVATTLEQTLHVHVTFPWWDAQDPAMPRDLRNEVAREEIKALTHSQILVVLDKNAGVGTATEMGFFAGLAESKGEKRQCLRVVHGVSSYSPFAAFGSLAHINDMSEGRLDWFGDLMAGSTVLVTEWHAPLIAVRAGDHLKVRRREVPQLFAKPAIEVG